jgi:hypothetical protein
MVMPRGAKYCFAAAITEAFESNAVDQGMEQVTASRTGDISPLDAPALGKHHPLCKRHVIPKVDSRCLPPHVLLP